MKTIFKKISTIGTIILILSFFFSLLLPTPTNAFDGRTGSACGNFLGFTSWDCGVKINNEKTLKTGILQIAANVATDASVLAAYLVLGYTIYGGYLYMFSGGDTNKVAAGKKTLSQAFIGLAITMSAYVIMSSLRFAMLGAGGTFNCDIDTGANCANPTDVVNSMVQWVIAMGGVISVIFIIYGGIGYVTSAGDANKLQKSKNAITYALIGLAIVALAEIITAFVTGLIKNAI